MKAILRARLQALLPGVAVDWNLSVQGMVPPRVVLFVVSGGADYVQEGPSGLRRARVQIDCYAATYAAADMLSRQVTTALSGWRDGDTILGVFLDQVRDFPADTGAGEVLGRVSSDFFINYKEA